MVTVTLGSQSDALNIIDSTPVLFAWYFDGLYYYAADPSTYTNPTYVTSFSSSNFDIIDGVQYHDRLTFTLVGNTNIAREKVDFYGNDLSIDPTTGRLGSGEILSIRYTLIEYPDMNASFSGLSISAGRFLEFANTSPSDGENPDLINFVSETFGGSDIFYLSARGDQVYGYAGNDVIHGDAGNDTLHGDDGADSILGEAGNDALYGGTDEDTLDGGNGSDTLYGADGNDRLIAGAGNDILDGGAGEDIVSFNDINQIDEGTGVKVSLLDGTWIDQIGGVIFTDTLINIERVGGSEESDVIEGNGSDNWLNGNAGDDHISGLDGGDFMQGQEGNDTLDGSSGNDTLLGGDGVDLLLGGRGNDTIDGGTGNDVLTGGGGLDTASYESAAHGVRVRLTVLVPQNTVGAGTDKLTAQDPLIVLRPPVSRDSSSRTDGGDDGQPFLADRRADGAVEAVLPEEPWQAACG